VVPPATTPPPRPGPRGHQARQSQSHWQPSRCSCGMPRCRKKRRFMGSIHGCCDNDTISRAPWGYKWLLLVLPTASGGAVNGACICYQCRPHMLPMATSCAANGACVCYQRRLAVIQLVVAGAARTKCWCRHWRAALLQGGLW
jgi:hypothetical protein